MFLALCGVPFLRVCNVLYCVFFVSSAKLSFIFNGKRQIEKPSIKWFFYGIPFCFTLNRFHATNTLDIDIAYVEQHYVAPPLHYLVLLLLRFMCHFLLSSA